MAEQEALTRLETSAGQRTGDCNQIDGGENDHAKAVASANPEAIRNATPIRTRRSGVSGMLQRRPGKE